MTKKSFRTFWFRLCLDWELGSGSPAALSSPAGACLAGRQGALQEDFGLLIATLDPIQLGKVVEAGEGIGMFLAQFPFRQFEGSAGR
uniref:Uncharacterized protein n=1 Tax=Candidatus Kentrum eta TaxID=2126337 RepID=A0A450VP30_9GAMM|nr:MAG: hypothetical protein BECKH772B_GA0070898_103623 [Candidatus Kentron sp. H]VFK03884.1 MAG: hypothetical protein BECKH772A_GA0070896_103623 [Candidatus Kentron sp. H]VFK06564.1 MAG: hypothetical protein BECKH772C_GA0070978_103583 [Candidatus Kentron sp. H]